MVSRKLILIFLAGTVLMMILLRIQGGQLITPDTPAGILSLEFANNSVDTQVVVNAWQGTLKQDFEINMLFDFLFIFFYGTFLYFTSLYYSQKSFSLKGIGRLTGFGIIAAVVFDVVENILMLISMNIEVHPVVSFLTFLFATLKFLLILSALISIIVAITHTSFKGRVIRGEE